MLYIMCILLYIMLYIGLHVFYSYSLLAFGLGGTAGLADNSDHSC